MSDTTVLRQNAIVRNASVGASPPHGPLKTGELPLVQVRQPPGGPQVQEGQQKAVTILPPKDAESALKTGGLPMVKVKMADGKPKPDDGRDSPVVIRDNRQTVAVGSHPMVQVKMENGRPQIQTAPNIAPGPPQIQSAAPALSAPRVGQASAGPRVTRIAAPRPALAAPQVDLPPVPVLSTEELMLYRHLVENYLTGLRAASAGSTDAPIEDSDAAKFAVAVAAKLDDILVATVVHAEAAALAASAASAAPAPVAHAYVAPRPVTGGHFSPASLSPVVSPVAPRNTGYVAHNPGTRSHVGGGRTQGTAGYAPRRVQRTPQPGAAPLPMVQVTMDGRQPIVQQQMPADVVAAVVDAAPAAIDAVATDTQG